MRRRMSSNPLTSGFRMRRPYHARVIMDWRRAMAAILAVVMTVVMTPAADARGLADPWNIDAASISAVGSGDDTGVTVVSNGTIVTDPTIVAATQSATLTTLRTDSSPAYDTETVDDSSSDSADSGTADATDSTSADSSSTESQPQVTVGTATLGGRDFEGQVTKEINGKTYILIGNEQQLRAIGSDKKVIGRIVSVTQTCTHTGTLTYAWVDGADRANEYVGDADLAADATLRDQDADDNDKPLLACTALTVGQTRTKYYGVAEDGTLTDVKAANTGQTYKADANYIIFRDIDLSSNAADPTNTNWTPLMFSTIMLGAKSKNPDSAQSLWDGINATGDAVTDQADRPTISNVTVRQTGKINQQKQSGIGFFATISNQVSLDSNSSGLKSLGETVVSNIRLDKVTVSNESTETEDSLTLVSGLMTVLGTLVYTIGLLLDVITSIIGINLDLRDLLKNLLDIRANDPSIFATGGFVGRVDGEVTVSKCEVSNVAVSNVKGMTGGFVGYATGETQYDILSNVLGSVISVLSYILNLIPGLGLGDLVTWLLNSKILDVKDLIPVGYYNPTFSENSVSNFQSGTVIGSQTQDYAGGFVGNQIGTIIENSTVTSTVPYTVKARYYAGGFSGVMRNGVMQGALSDLGVQLPKIVAEPQSLVEGSSVDANVTVQSGSYSGGFAGAMANSFAVNDTVNGVITVTAEGVVKVSGTGSDAKETVVARAGGFAGVATIGWISDLGSEDASDSNLLSTVNKLLVDVLTKNDEGASALLSLVGIDPSAILGVKMSGTISVHSDDDFAGGIIGRGDGSIIAASDVQHLDDFSFWKHGRTVPVARNNTVSGLQSVTTNNDYAGGIAGQLGTASIGGVVNDTVGLGGYLPFEVSALTVNGVADGGYTVKATGDYASAGIGKATGGYIGQATTAYKSKSADGNVTNNVPETAGVTLNGVKSVEANNFAGGFIGESGPGDLVGSDGLDLLGLGLLKIKGLLSVAEGVMVQAKAVNVNGNATGMTVAATGKHKTNDVIQYVAGGFVGQSNSTQVTDTHVSNLSAVTADDTYGNAGGFVGVSVTGGLADVADNDSILELVKIDGGLVKAIGYMIPTYTNADVRYINGGTVEANIAGGFAGDFQSGKVDNSTKVNADGTQEPWAVINIDTVTGGAYAGGFGGKVHSGALANSDGGISILGNISGLNISAADLASVASAYVPVITAAGVRSDDSTVEKTSGEPVSDPDNPGVKVSATSLDALDAQSGSAGGYIGYGSGVQVSQSDVTQLRHTTVKAPNNLETTGSIDDTYLSGDKSTYAVTGARYAGGYIGKMDLGAAASVGGGLSVLGTSIKLDDVLSVLDVVVSTIEHSDVTGGIGGYSILASTANHKKDDNTADPLGMAGGFAGYIKGGHIQDSSSHEFVYIIGQVSAGGYAGTMEPGAVADVLGDGSILKKLVNIDSLLSLVQDFVPTIRNSSTDAAICGGAVRAQATSDETTRRGMAGGYVGRNRGGHIWGNNTAAWKSENTDGKYNGPQRVAYAARIRSVYGQEIAGGYVGMMEAADTADTGSLSLLGGLIQAGNIAGVLSVVYPTEEHTKVTGPLRNMSYDQWQTWVNNIGKYGAYGKEFTNVVEAGADKVTDQDSLDKFLENYVFGFNVVAGRGVFDGMADERQECIESASNDDELAKCYELGANLRDSGVAGGHVGLMRTGTITDGQSMDVRNVTAMRAAGGYAGTMEAGTAATFGSVNILGLNLDLGQLLNVASVFVPVVKSSSVIGYRKGMSVKATGVETSYGNGNAGGYVGMTVGGQIWGDRDHNGDELVKDNQGAYTTAAVGADVKNLRKVSGTNNVGGYVGLATSGSVADVDTNAASGFLSKVLDKVISTPASLVQVLQATVVTIRGAHVSPDDSAWGFTVEGSYTQTTGTGDTAVSTTKYSATAGGFAGSLQAAILGDRNSAKGSGTAADTSNDPAENTVTGLRAVEGGQYAGGFFGLADVSSVASVGGGTSGTTDDTNLLLSLLKVGNIGVLEAFRTFIYDGRVTGVADGIQVKAHTSTTSGLLDSTRFTGAAGGFGGGLINGSVKKSSVTNLNSVTGLNYTGGFIGHLGKSGTVDASKAEVADSLLAGLTAGVMDIWGSHVEDSTVAGISAGFTVTATHNGEDYGRGESLTDAKNRKGEEIAAGFAGYADLSRISGATVTNFKKASSGELAGGFVGQTTKAYLVDAGVNSKLVELLLKYVVNPLLDILYVNDIEHIGDKLDDLKEKHFGWLTKFIDLELFTDGNALYVNLLGLKIGVALDKHGTENDDTDDTAYIFIGDSKIEVGCSKDGVNSDSVDNVKVQLIKANRTKISNSLVQGIADGYDVFGGGATQDSDGTDGLKTGYAGGFVAVNDEGLLENNNMTYADTIRGTSGLVGPFSGKTNLESVYDFNTVYGIEGNGNTYHIYRDVPETWSYALTAARKQFTYGSHMDNAAKADGMASDTAGALKLNLNRYDVAHLARSLVPGTTDQYTIPYIQQFADYKDAVMANNVSGSNTGSSAGGVANESAPLGVYVSAAQADLMLGVAVSDNNGGLTPEPDDGQDPCGLDGCRTVDLTLQKVWKDADSGLARPQSITLQITATYTDANGETVTPESIDCSTDGCETIVNQRNPWTVTLDASDGALWSDTWRKKISGLPVAFVDTGSGANGEDVVRYYTYTVAEIAMTYPKDADKTPTEAGYTVNVSYDNKEYVATVTNSVPSLPNTGGTGTAWIVAIAVLILSLGSVWYLRDSDAGGARRKRGRHAGA